MTHSLSTLEADRPPAIYRSATFAIVVSSTSMNVGMTTAEATSQGLIAGRLTAVWTRVALLTREPLLVAGGPSRETCQAWSMRYFFEDRSLGLRALWGRVERLQDLAGVRPGGTL